MQSKINRLNKLLSTIKDSELSLNFSEEQISELLNKIRNAQDLCFTIKLFKEISNNSVLEIKKEQNLQIKIIPEPAKNIIENEISDIEKTKKIIPKKVAEKKKAEVLENFENINKLELNDKNKKEENSLEYTLKKRTIKDLRTEINLNDKFLFSNELFDNNMEEFNNAINLLNHFKDKKSAIKYIDKDLKPKFNWNYKTEITKKFISLIKRRY